MTEAACPFGSYDRRVLESLRGSGYRRVYTSDRGTTDAEDYLQARNTVGPDDRPELLSEIASLERTRCQAREAGGEAVAVTAPTKRRTEVRPIGPDDVGAVAEFLHEHLNQRVCTGAWARSVEVPWDDDRPNAGIHAARRRERRRRPPGVLLERGRSTGAPSASATSAPGACSSNTGSTG